MARINWTRQLAIERIQALHQQGVPVGKISSVDPPLHSKCYLMFGSWRTALAEAGLESARRSWTREQVLVELKAEHLANSLRRPSHRRRNWCLNAAAVKFYGTRRKAMAAAGITGLRPKKAPGYWTKARVIAAIVARHEKGLSLTNVWKEDRPLCLSSRRLFGSIKNALKAAGFPQDDTPKLTREEILQKLRTMHENGESLVGIWRTNKKFFHRIANQFGTLQNALAAADLPSRRARRWTKRLVIEAIQSRKRNGPGLSGVWRDDKSLFRASINHFGNWQSAMVAAKVEFKARNRWTKDRVVERLRQTYRGQPNLHDVDPSLTAAAIYFHGGLHIAIEAAGLEPSCRKWNKKRVIETIQELYIQGKPIAIVGFGDKSLTGAAYRFFGTWPKAVEAAGLESRIPPPRYSWQWSRDTVLREIRSRAESETKLCSCPKLNNCLYQAAKKHFGTWREAVRAAGCIPTRRSWSRKVVIREIQQRHQRDLPLTDSIFGQDPPLVDAAIRFFGTWRSALKAAGIPETKRPKRKAIRHR